MNAGMGVSTPSQAPAFVPTRHCEVVREFSRLEQFSSDWERLWRADPKAEIFQSFAWARAWWEGYGHNFSLCSLVVFDSEEVIGILPLVKKEGVISFLGGAQSDYCDILCEEARTIVVVSAAVQGLFSLSDWKSCVLRNVKFESRVPQNWSSLPQQVRDNLQIVPSAGCHTMLLDQDPNILFSLLRKRHTRRRLNKLSQAGTVVFRHLQEQGEAQIHLELFLKHQVRKRAMAGKKSAASSLEFQRFLRALIRELDLKNELRFGVLELDGCPLAWHLSFGANSKLVLYQQAIDVDAWDYTPGEVLLHQLLLYVQQNAIRELDFTHGNEPFKDRFTTHTRKMCSLYLDRPGAPARLRQVFRMSIIPWSRLANYVQHVAKRNNKTRRAFRSIHLWGNGILERARHYQRQGKLFDRRQKSGGRRRLMPLYKKQLGLFLRSDSSKVERMHAPHSDLIVNEGRIGDLIDLASQNPQITVAFELSRYRQRLKQGHMLYLVRQGTEIILAAWVTTFWPEDFLPLRDTHPSLPRDLFLIYDLWIVGSMARADAYRELLMELSKVARERKLIPAICCEKEFSVLCSQLELLGFQQTYQLKRSRTGRQFWVTPASPAIPTSPYK